MAKEKTDLVYGTLDMLILKALQHDPRHGLAIADRIEQMSKDILRVEQGSLYPALYRLEAQGWIKAEWGVSDNNRKARYYKLTLAGRKQLAAEQEHWSRITKGIDLVLSGARKICRDFAPGSLGWSDCFAKITATPRWRKKFKRMSIF